MIIETVIAAKSLWYLDLRNLNPRGRNLYRLLGPLAQQWYGFTPPTEFNEEKGVEFIGGEFSPSGRGQDMTGIALTVFHNGLVALTTTNTNDGDTFLTQALVRFAGEGVISYRPEMIRKRQYSSEVVARSDRKLALPSLDGVYKKLSSFVYGGSHDFDVSGLVLDVDPLTPGRQVPLRFERRGNTPFSENSYYSHGPLSTDQHQLVLDEIERALAV